MKKKCMKCKKTKYVKEFPKRADSADGYRNECKDCRKVYQKNHYIENNDYYKKYYSDNKERISEHNKKHRCKIKQKDYYIKNRSRILKRQKEYQKKNKDRVRKYQKEYFQTEKGKEILYKNSLRRYSYKQKVDFTPHQRKDLLERDNWTCNECKIKVHDESKGEWNTPNKAHIDHIIPISKGGDSSPENLQILCRTCNLTKHNNTETLIDEFGQVALNL